MLTVMKDLGFCQGLLRQRGHFMHLLQRLSQVLVTLRRIFSLATAPGSCLNDPPIGAYSNSPLSPMMGNLQSNLHSGQCQQVIPWSTAVADGMGWVYASKLLVSNDVRSILSINPNLGLSALMWAV